MRSLWKLATRAGEQERLQTLRDLDAAALQLRDACLVFLETAHPDQQVREKVYEQVAQNGLVQGRVGSFCPITKSEPKPKNEQHYHFCLATRLWKYICTFDGCAFTNGSAIEADVCGWTTMESLLCP